MKNMTRYTSLIAILAAAQCIIAEDTVQILTTGLHHGDEVTAESGPDWWGIFPEGDGFTLQQAPVTITIEHDVIVDEEGQATGKLVKVPQEAKPVLLVRGIAGLKEGRIDAVKTESLPRMLYPGQTDSIRLPTWKEGTSLGLTALGEARGESDYREVGIYNYQIKIDYGPQQNRKRQVVLTIPDLQADATPRLVWAGDLDRDGKLDLLFDASYHYNVSLLMLYLSSAAKEGELVGRVAEWKTTGC
jgi:hypothetical protein